MASTGILMSTDIPIPDRALTLSPLIEDGVAPGDVVALVVAASRDPTIRAMNYVPHAMDDAQAREYCATSDGVVLRLDGEPVGVSIVRHAPQAGEGIAIPEGCVELEEWVLPPYRGQGLFGKRGWPLITAWLAPRFQCLLGVIWEDNDHAQALVRTCGWRRLGRSFWRSAGYARAGYCEVFVYDLAPHRGASEVGR
jgi:hypothetical protein